MKTFLSKADVLIGHNIIRFDTPVLERILGIKIKAKLIDTLALSWYLFPDKPKHGLEVWGNEFGVEKPSIKDWKSLSIQEYIHRCEEDVKINTRLWKLLIRRLSKIYNNDEKEIWRIINYLSFKMDMARLQEESGWKLDIDFCSKSLGELLQEREEKIKSLSKAMPKVPIKAKKSAPKKPRKKDGTLSAHGQAWFDLLKEQNLPEDVEEIEYITGYNDPNPASPEQVKDWLFSLGWKPSTIKYVKNKNTGEIREIPQINQEHGKGICPSIKKLFEIEPRLEALDGLSVLNHRIPILQGFLHNLDNKGLVYAKIQGLTNTLRFKHAHPCVNLPKVGKPYADGIRGSLIASSPEHILCGADKSGLEDRLKQHFIYPLDPKYVESMQQEDWDPHLDLALTAGKISQQQMDDYKNEVDKSIKPIRDIFKSGNYACQYNAYPPRLAITCDISLDEAKELFEIYWKKNWAIKEVAQSLNVKEVDGLKWLKNPISGFWYNLRKENDRFSTLVQGSASYVFDLWVSKVLKIRRQLTAQFHDEIVLDILREDKEKITNILNKTIEQTNKQLNLNRRLDIGIQFGNNYAEIH